MTGPTPSATAMRLLEIACRLISFTGEPGAWEHCWISRAIDWRDRYEALDSGQAPAEAEPEGGRLAAIRAVLAGFDWSRGDIADLQGMLERIEQIAGSSRTASGIEPGGSASLLPADVATVLDALDIAAECKRDRVETCPDCDVRRRDLCSTCEHRLAVAQQYDALAAKLGGDL